jgi:hypothetical protein
MSWEIEGGVKLSCLIPARFSSNWLAGRCQSRQAARNARANLHALCRVWLQPRLADGKLPQTVFYHVFTCAGDVRLHREDRRVNAFPCPGTLSYESTDRTFMCIPW